MAVLPNGKAHIQTILKTSMALENAQLLVVLNQHNIALLFADYLRSQGIANEVQHTQQGFAIFCQVADLERAHQLFQEFIENPDDAKYQSLAWQSSKVTDVKHSNKSLLDVFKENFVAHAGVLTLIIFAACWLVFLLSYFGFARDVFSQLRFFSHLDLSLLFSEPYRLLTPALFHFSLLHIAFNTLWWWQLGGDIEKRLGTGSLIHIFLLTAIISNLGQYLVSGPNFGGLSGVVYGLFGYVWWFGWLRPEQGLSLSNNIVGFLLIWLVLGFVDILPINMANTAHLLGLITGCLLAFFKVQKLKSAA